MTGWKALGEGEPWYARDMTDRYAGKNYGPFVTALDADDWMAKHDLPGYVHQNALDVSDPY